MTQKHILIAVESYSGSGHMNVTAEISKAIQAGGHRVTIAASASSFEVGKQFNYAAANRLEFPALSLDTKGRAVITHRNVPLEQDPISNAERLQQFQSFIANDRPDMALIEGWPFGINELDNHFENIAQALKIADIPTYGVARDTLGYPNPRMNNTSFHDITSVRLANTYFNSIFVTADKTLTTLDQSLSHVAFRSLEIPVHYIGNVGTAGMPTRQPMADHLRPIIITGGGAYKGVVREHMMAMVTGLSAALPQTSLAHNPVLISIGATATPDDISALRDITRKTGLRNDQVSIETTIPSNQFRTIVANAAMQIHKGSRNSSLDALQARIPQIISPLTDESGEWAEHKMRAASLQSAGLSVTLSFNELVDPALCAARIESALKTQGKVKSSKLDMLGAKNLASTVTCKLNATC